MKKRQIIYAILAAVFLVAAGAIFFSQQGQKGSTASTSGISVQVAAPISSSFNQDALSQLTNVSVTQDFAIQLNVATGLGNTAPFGK